MSAVVECGRGCCPGCGECYGEGIGCHAGRCKCEESDQ